MDVEEPTPKLPVFSGESSRACEEFIRNVRTYAFSQGKQRDSAWMADFTSTCLDGAALRFFSKLGSDVQEDWGLLNNALLQQYPSEESVIVPSPASAVSPPRSATLVTPAAAAPTARTLPQPPSPAFSVVDPDCRGLGVSSSDSSPAQDPSFGSAAIPTLAACPPLATRNISGNVAAFGEHNGHGSGISSGPFTSSFGLGNDDPPPTGATWITPDAFSSTTALPTQDVRGSLQGSAYDPSKPGPAAPPTLDPLPTTLPRAGRIKGIIQKGSDQVGAVKYVDRSISWGGGVEYTDKVNNALYVEYMPSARPGLLRMLNGPDDHTYLGIRWTKQPISLGPGSINRAQVTPVSLSSNSEDVARSSTQIGERGAAVWSVGGDNTIRATWNDGNELDILFPGGGWLYVAGDQKAYVKKKGGEDYKTRWTFEPL